VNAEAGGNELVENRKKAKYTAAGREVGGPFCVEGAFSLMTHLLRRDPHESRERAIADRDETTWLSMKKERETRRPSNLRVGDTWPSLFLSNGRGKRGPFKGVARNNLI